MQREVFNAFKERGGAGAPQPAPPPDEQPAEPTRPAPGVTVIRPLKPIVDHDGVCRTYTDHASRNAPGGKP